MKYLVISLADFSVLSKDAFDEDTDLKVAQVFTCSTAAKLAASKVTLGCVVIPLRELQTTEDLQERIYNQQLEIDSLKTQLDEYTKS